MMGALNSSLFPKVKQRQEVSCELNLGWQLQKCLRPEREMSRCSFKDVRVHCYCASLVRTLFIRHARATSFSSVRTKSKSQQNIELMSLALTWCANIFCWMLGDPLFFRQITSFSDSFLKNKKKSVRGKF